MRHKGQDLENLYDQFNGRHFLGRLPRYSVRTDLRKGTPGFGDELGKTIHLPVEVEDPEAALLHEMIHLAVGTTHEGAFRRELERIATAGETAAQRALALEEWHERTERVGKLLAERNVNLSPREVRERILAAAGEAPSPAESFPWRGMLAWMQERKARG